ncbi:MAG: NUDIX domain-containing protein [Nanoarchaeota archaeon]|nr:NUDIX domain-containing protein [Nanoarchaeota archaeon]
MNIVRRRGTAIVHTPQGILVVAGKRKTFLLPGGGAHLTESRQRAAIRELEEETGLKTTTCTYLFTYNEPTHGLHGKKKKVRNLHKVFLITTQGNAEANQKDEVKYLAYWKPGSHLKISAMTKKIIQHYLDLQVNV